MPDWETCCQGSLPCLPFYPTPRSRTLPPSPPTSLARLCRSVLLMATSKRMLAATKCPLPQIHLDKSLQSRFAGELPAEDSMCLEAAGMVPEGCTRCKPPGRQAPSPDVLPSHPSQWTVLSFLVLSCLDRTFFEAALCLVDRRQANTNRTANVKQALDAIDI